MIDDASADEERVRRLVLCSGKIYYDIVGHELRAGADTVAVARLEQLYPFPVEAAAALVGSYPNLDGGRLGAGGAAEHGRVALDPPPARGGAARRACRSATWAGRGARARARATRPRTCASRTGSSAPRWAARAGRLEGGRSRSDAAAAAPSGAPAAAITGPYFCACRGDQLPLPRAEPPPDVDRRQGEADRSWSSWHFRHGLNPSTAQDLSAERRTL